MHAEVTRGTCQITSPINPRLLFFFRQKPLSQKLAASASLSGMSTRICLSPLPSTGLQPCPSRHSPCLAFTWVLWIRTQGLTQELFSPREPPLSPTHAGDSETHCRQCCHSGEPGEVVQTKLSDTPGKGKLGTLVDKDNFRAQWELEAGEEPAWTAHSFVTLDRSPQVPERPLQTLSSEGRDAAGILGWSEGSKPGKKAGLGCGGSSVGNDSVGNVCEDLSSIPKTHLKIRWAWWHPFVTSKRERQRQKVPGAQ